MQSIASLMSIKPLEDIGNLDDFDEATDWKDNADASAKISELASQFGQLVEESKELDNQEIEKVFQKCFYKKNVIQIFKCLYANSSIKSKNNLLIDQNTRKF